MRRLSWVFAAWSAPWSASGSTSFRRSAPLPIPWTSTDVLGGVGRWWWWDKSLFHQLGRLSDFDHLLMIITLELLLFFQLCVFLNQSFSCFLRQFVFHLFRLDFSRLNRLCNLLCLFNRLFFALFGSEIVNFGSDFKTDWIAIGLICNFGRWRRRRWREASVWGEKSPLQYRLKIIVKSVTALHELERWLFAKHFLLSRPFGDVCGGEFFRHPFDCLANIRRRHSNCWILTLYFFNIFEIVFLDLTLASLTNNTVQGVALVNCGLRRRCPGFLWLDSLSSGVCK